MIFFCFIMIKFALLLLLVLLLSECLWWSRLRRHHRRRYSISVWLNSTCIIIILHLHFFSRHFSSMISAYLAIHTWKYVYVLCKHSIHRPAIGTHTAREQTQSTDHKLYVLCSFCFFSALFSKPFYFLHFMFLSIPFFLRCCLWLMAKKVRASDMRPPNGGEKWHHERRRIEYLCTDIVGIVFAMAVVAIFGFDIHWDQDFPICVISKRLIIHTLHTRCMAYIFPLTTILIFFISWKWERLAGISSIYRRVCQWAITCATQLQNLFQLA